MKTYFVVAGILLTAAAFARNIAVLAKGESFDLASGTQAARPAAPLDQAATSFLAAFEADLAHPAAFAATENLSAPPEWGRTVAGAGGTIQYHDSFAGGFVVRVALAGLAPRHRYILTLNGNPSLPGNDRLVDPVPGNPKERYFDFLTVTTDANGAYDATFGVRLLAGPYGTRFYVKDTDDFKIVLYHDYFRFAVE